MQKYEELAERYLALLRRTLTRMDLGDEGTRPFAPAQTGNVGRQWSPADPYKRRKGRDWPRHAETMVGLERLGLVHGLLNMTRDAGIPGDWAECGVWRGGVSIYAAAWALVYHEPMHVYCFDSFEGLPEGGRYKQDEGDPHHTQNDIFAVGSAEVMQNFVRYDIPDFAWTAVRGFFRDSLPVWREEQGEHPLRILRIDADMYEGTHDALMYLEPNVSPGGYIIIDDYGDVTACRTAVHDYLHNTGQRVDIEEFDHTCVWWRKP
jgi:O-methyltransferase